MVSSRRRSTAAGHLAHLGAGQRKQAPVFLAEPRVLIGPSAPENDALGLSQAHLGQTLPLAAQLAGFKILVPGNHDRCWTGHGGTRQGWIETYRAAGFDEIHQGAFELDIAGTQVLVNHFPYVGDGDRFEKHRPVDTGGWLLHGHVHQRWPLRDRMINVGVDVWDFYAVSEGALADVIAVSNRQRAQAEQARPSDVMEKTERRLKECLIKRVGKPR